MRVSSGAMSSSLTTALGRVGQSSAACANGCAENLGVMHLSIGNNTLGVVFSGAPKFANAQKQMRDTEVAEVRWWTSKRKQHYIIHRPQSPDEPAGSKFPKAYR